MLNAVAPACVAVYMFAVVVAMYIAMYVRLPLRRIFYLTALAVMMFICSISIRPFLLFINAGSVVEYAGGRIIVRPVYEITPYGEMLFLLLAGLSAVPAILVLASIPELVTRRRI